MNLFKKWKQEWWDREELKLCKEFETELNELKSNLDSTLDDWKKKKEDAEMGIRLQQESLKSQEMECAELSKRLQIRSRELTDLNDALKYQIRTIEEKSSPSSVWTEAFNSGWNKAWDIMMPYIQESAIKAAKVSRENTIDELLKNNPRLKNDRTK